MTNRDLPSFEDEPVEEEIPTLLRGENVSTQSIDIKGVFPSDITQSGSFEVKEVHTSSFGKLLQAIPIPVLLINVAGKIAFANTSWEKIHPEYLLLLHNQAFPKIFHNVISARNAVQILKEVFRTRVPQVSESIIILGDRKIWGRMNFRSLRNGDQRSVLVLIEDLTLEKKQQILNRKHRLELQARVKERTAELHVVNERLRLEIQEKQKAETALKTANEGLEQRVIERTRELAESELRYRSLVENSSEGIYRATWEGKFISANPALAKILGYDSVEDLLTNLTDFRTQLYVDPVDREHFLREIAMKKQLTNYEIYCYRKNKQKIWVSLNSRVCEDEKGNFQYFEGMFQDITERKHAEKELHQALELQGKLLATAATGIFMVNHQRVVTMVNDEFCHITGYERDDIVGKPCTIFMRENCVQNCHLLHPNTGTMRQECTIRTQKGNTLITLKNMTPMRDDSGQLIGGIESFSDVTELVEARIAAEHASRAKSDFLANISHEIRTPMHGIIGMTDLLWNTNPSTEQKEYLEAVKVSADALLMLINDVLDFSKIEAGKFNLSPVDFSISSCLKKAVSSMIVQAKNKGLNLEYKLDESIPDRLKGDPGRLRQILLNLLGNAIKFTDTGFITLNARLKDAAEQHVELIFEVTDSGIGIPVDKQKRIFNAFEQAEHSTNRKYGGTGLGLAICVRLVRMMHGEITVKSEVGKGSTFTFSVRLGYPSVDQSNYDDQGRPVKIERHVDRPALNILLAEDNLVNQKLACRLLEKMGHKTTIAGNGLEALKLLSDHKYDLILMDIQMPEMDGLETTMTIRRNEASTGQRIPIIAMTAYAMKEDKEKCLAAGMDAHLSKPIKTKELAAVLESYQMQIASKASNK